MKVLNGILKESKEYYFELEKEIQNRIKLLPKGSIKKRLIKSKIYYYLQYRDNKKIIHKYLGKVLDKKIEKQIEERKKLEKQLIEVKKSIKMLKKIKNYD